MKFSNEQVIIRMCDEKLTEVFGTSVRILSTHPLGGGCINHAIKLHSSEGIFFLKWNSSAPNDMFLREAEGLTEMKNANSGLIIPEVIWSKEIDETPGLLLTSFLNPPLDLGGYDDRLGRGLARLHRKTNQFYGFYHSNYCGTTVQENNWTDSWPDFYGQQRIWNLVNQLKVVRGMPAEELKIYEKLIDRMAVLLPHQTVPSLIHGDLWSGNYMYT